MAPAPRAAARAAAVLAAIATVLAAPQVRPDAGSTVSQTGRATPTRAAQVIDARADTAVLRPSANRHGTTLFSTASPPRAAGDLHPDLHHAYWLAVQSAPDGCHPELTLLAAIGMVESGNAVGRHVDDDHRVVPALVGPALDGVRRPAVPDTDAGQLDGDRTWDRAVGPLQLVPEVWRAAGVDMDGDGRRDPQNVFDAAGAAVVYLCAGDRDLATPEGRRQAIRSYNRAPGYLAAVLGWKALYDREQDERLVAPPLLVTYLGPTAAPEQVVGRTWSLRDGAALGDPGEPSPAVAVPASAADTAPLGAALPPAPTPPTVPAGPMTPPVAPGPGPTATPGPTAAPAPTASASPLQPSPVQPSPPEPDVGSEPVPVPTPTPVPAPLPFPPCPPPTDGVLPVPVDPAVPLPDETLLCLDEAGVLALLAVLPSS